MRRPLRVGTLLLALSLGGCATLQTPPAADAPAVAAAWDSRQRQLSATQGFDATGRIAVKGGGLSGSLAWQQEGERFSLRVAGPFGAGALSMEGTPDLVTLKGKDLDLTTSDPQTVLAERTGWRLPLAALRWWVLGLPAPAPYTALRLDAEGNDQLVLLDFGATRRFPRRFIKDYAQIVLGA